MQVRQLHLLILLPIEANATSDKGESGDTDEALFVLESRLWLFVGLGINVHLSFIISY